MHFLKQLFSGNAQVSSQVEKAGAKNQEKVRLNASQHLPTSSHNIQKNMQEKYLKKDVPQYAQFDLQKEVRKIPQRLVEFKEIKMLQSQFDVDFGFLIGVINKKHSKSSFIPPTSHQVCIGCEEQVTSVKSLRRDTLDSLVVFLHEQNSGFDLEQLMESGQRLVFIAQTWNTLKQFLLSHKQLCLSKDKTKPITSLVPHLISNLYSFNSQFILQFQSPSAFASSLQQRIPILTTAEETERLIKSMTVQEYHQLIGSEGSWFFLEDRIKGIKLQIENEVILRRLEAQLDNHKNEKVLEQEQEMVQKQNTMDLELREDEEEQAEYFKRESQKQTRESGSRRPQHSDFYFFIEEHSNSEESDDDREQPRTTNYQLSELPEYTEGRVRSNSLDLKFSFPTPEANQQFFTKY